MGKVSIVRTDHNLNDNLQRALNLIGGLDHFITPHETVMLKPNLNGLEGYTNIILVEALIQMLLDLPVRKIVIAEATFGSAQMTEMFFHKTGYAELARKYSVPWINLNASEAVETPVKQPLILEKLRIAKEVFDVDKIINLPNMKVHYATGITLALKNMKGVLVGDEKKHFHDVGLEKAIVDLNNMIQPHLTVVDAISCMERMGPRGGDQVNLNLILAGENSADIDYVGARIMGYGLHEVKHLELYANMNGVDFSAIEVVGERIEEVAYPFKKVCLDQMIPTGFSIHAQNACSACMNALLLSCQLLEGTLTREINVYLGSGQETEARNSDALRLAFGNCCSKEIPCDIRIHGCPPYPFTLRERLKDYVTLYHDFSP